MNIFGINELLLTSISAQISNKSKVILFITLKNNQYENN